MATKNITLKIDEEVYRKARIRAAEDGTSVSAMVREYLILLAKESQDETHTHRVTSLQALYSRAEARATPRSEPLVPLTREEIYHERLR